jgi:hypothetical protein
MKTGRRMALALVLAALLAASGVAALRTFPASAQEATRAGKEEP